MFRNNRGKRNLFRRVHWNLTIVFASIAGLILIFMSAIYLFMSEKELKDNRYLSFLNESDTVFSNLEHQDMLTYNWLSSVGNKKDFLFAIYDNGKLLSHAETALSKEQKHMVSDVLSIASQKLSPSVSAPEGSSDRIYFDYDGSDGNTYYTNVLRIKNASSFLYAVILYSTRTLEQKLLRQRLYFCLIDISGLMLLLTFSFFYTKKLLSPIKENAEKQDAFIAAASHELRTPLAVILASLKAFRQTDQHELKEQFLSTIEKEGRQMSSLIDDMLALSKANSQNWSFQMKETELDTLLLNSYEQFLPLAREKEITLFIDIPDTGIPICICDSGRLSQALGNLISNAISYGKYGGYIKLAIRHSFSHILLTVEDNGAGISDEAKAHIFDRFYREDFSRNDHEHFGLGLCIAKEIIELHHGSITVSDTEGGGTTFTISLPAKK